MAADPFRFFSLSGCVSLLWPALFVALVACNSETAGPSEQVGGASGAAGQGPAGGGAGADQAGAAGEGGARLIYSYAAPACGDCLAAHCAAELDTCKTSTSCLAITGCFSQCESSSPDCRVRCDNTPWRPDEVAAGVRACQVSACAEPCAITCGGMLARTDDCAACGPAHCCDEAAACGGSQDCQRLDACVLQCKPGTTCAASCEERFPAGKAAREAWRGCLTAACGEECGRGHIAPPP